MYEPKSRQVARKSRRAPGLLSTMCIENKCIDHNCVDLRCIEHITTWRVAAALVGEEVTRWRFPDAPGEGSLHGE